MGGNPWTRNMAMVHVAMSDAVNAVQNKYALYVPAGTGAGGFGRGRGCGSLGPSSFSRSRPEGPDRTGFEASTKDPFPDGAAKKDGIAIGEKCAAAIIADRASDGTNVPDTYRPVTTPGIWIPTAPPSSPSMPAPSPGS